MTVYTLFIVGTVTLGFFTNFVTCTDAQDDIQNVCSQKPKTGLCKASIPMWYYDGNTSTCKEFVYGGCGGGDNKFPTRAACMRKCATDKCLLPAETGPCRANIRQWFYDSNHRTCKEFSYGGCKGNDNRFPSKLICELVCAGTNLPCKLGKKFQIVGQHGVLVGARETDWFVGGCERKCRKWCLKSHSWGVCMAFSTDKKWYGKCKCYLHDRFLSDQEFDTESTGITKNRMCKSNNSDEQYQEL